MKALSLDKTSNHTLDRTNNRIQIYLYAFPFILLADFNGFNEKNGQLIMSKFVIGKLIKRFEKKMVVDS